MYDLLIHQATVVDGTGQASYVADVGIIGERIAKITKIGAIPQREDAGQGEIAARIIEGKGLVLTPGFVDIHSHSDYSLLIDPRGESKIRQGITCEVVGNCGYSAAPVTEPLLEERKKEYERQFGLSLDWRNFSEYLDRVERSAPAINYAFLVGHNTLRASAAGFGNQPPSPAQISRMLDWIEEALDCGAFGLSTGLAYAPACFAQKEELIALAARVARRGGILTTHMRSEGKGILSAMAEVLTIARRSSIPLQISHLKTSGQENWWKLDQALEMIESAREDGLLVTCDRYPYLAAQTSLQSLLPDWAQDGGPKALLARLEDRRARDTMAHDLLRMYPEEEYWANISISLLITETSKCWEGWNLSQIARRQNRSPVEVALDLLKSEETQVDILQFSMSEENLAKILKHPLTMIGSDSSSRAIDGPLRIGKPHPRSFGTFPRVIREFCYEKGILTLEEGIQKMTSLPCQKLGLKDRGLIQEGMFADLVLFDPADLADQATYQDPFHYPSGIRLVVVNGNICVEDNCYSVEDNCYRLYRPLGPVKTGHGKILCKK